MIKENLCTSNIQKSEITDLIVLTSTGLFGPS